LRIDFISDVACPWCVIGLRGLLKALEAVQGGQPPSVFEQAIREMISAKPQTTAS
jgi:predicted DsbA family dithiol-disulfide isomerase